jgi:hypothetical protein
VSNGGRPTDYTQERCEEVKAFMAEGASITEYAAHIGVSRRTVYQWAEDHDEFSHALTRARELSQAHWERELRENLIYNKECNAPLVKLYFANRFDWHDKMEQDNRSTDGSMSPAQVTRVIVDADDSGGTDDTDA